jgi:hypothetical protein
MPTVRRITAEARQNEYRISSFIQGIVGSPAFQMTRIPETTETAAQ